ncbi:ComGF family competence protein [Dubosiella newyorkensis]|jgi:competence protein ComGF|uniref:ComGF family competence protein n=1 Tax=Dubosiella newyorkensis TaxID=1862672 RepID=UPI0023543CC2|nr:ComGF family competence protein [Dubosiella newyorkensis]MCI9040856.1 ComGF family competence protein [Dubosiella newyorkensis]
MKSRSNGFTMIEALFSLLVVSLLIGLLSGFMQVASQIVKNHRDSQREFLVLQLRSFLAPTSSIRVDQGALEATIFHQSYRIEQDRDRLIKRGGYEILLENVEKVVFYEEEDKIYISIDKEEFQVFQRLY